MTLCLWDVVTDVWSTTRNVRCVVCVLERCEDRTETRMEEEDAKEEEEDVLLVVSDLSDQVQGGWCCRQSGGVTSWVAAQGVMVWSRVLQCHKLDTPH